MDEGPNVTFVGEEALMCCNYGAGVLGDHCRDATLRAISGDCLRS